MKTDPFRLLRIKLNSLWEKIPKFPEFNPLIGKSNVLHGINNRQYMYRLNCIFDITLNVSYEEKKKVIIKKDKNDLNCLGSTGSRGL